MRLDKSHISQQSTTPDLASLEPGIRILEPHHALTLQSPLAGVMEVIHGRVWATFDGPHCGPANDWGDRVLQEGDELHVHADQRLVVEPWARSARELVYFNFKWEPSHPTKLAA